jgi:hypothetical protein
VGPRATIESLDNTEGKGGGGCCHSSIYISLFFWAAALITKYAKNV